MVKRVYVKKKPGFDVEAKGLLADLQENLQMSNIENLVILNRYDVSGISDEVLETAKNTIFSEPQVDDCFVDNYEFNKNDKVFIIFIEAKNQKNKGKQDAKKELSKKISSLGFNGRIMEVHNPKGAYAIIKLS